MKVEKGPSPAPHPLPCTFLHLWLFAISTLPALFLSNPCWGNLGLLSTVTSICTWLSSWVHSSGKSWLLQSQCEESARSKSSAWVGASGKWKTCSFWSHLILVEKIWNLYWLIVCRLPNVSFFFFSPQGRRNHLRISLLVTQKLYVKLLPPTTKLPHKVGLGFGFFLLITNSSQLIHFEQMQDVDHCFVTPNF